MNAIATARAYVTAEEMHQFVPLAASCFWPFVQKGDGCWLWTGSTMDGRYGKVVFGSGRWCHAHRFAFFLHHGPIPPGMLVCHHCDTPPCCNPYKCLFLGTHAENMADMARKGRAVYRQKITLAEASEIIARFARGEKQKAIAVDYGIDRSTVSYLASGKYKYARGLL